MKLNILALFMFSACALASRRRTKRNTEDVAEMAQYFAQYTQLPNAMEGVVKLGYSSNDGRQHTPFDRSPAFVERVLEMESQTGLPESGRVTKELLKEAKKSRCGVGDPPKEADELGAFVVKSMWDSKYDSETGTYTLTFSIIDPESFPYYLTMDEVNEGLLSAMCLWEVNSNVRFKDIGMDNDDADITIKFVRGDHGDLYSFDGFGGTLAHAFYPENGRLHFDLDEDWYLARKETVNMRKKDIFTVAAHELGHSIGLMHSEKRGALMAPIYKYSGTVEEYRLPEDDIRGVENMYGRRVDSHPFRESGTACNLVRTKFGIAADKLVVANPPKAKKPKRVCVDDSRYKRYCGRWLQSGFCDHPEHGKTLRRRCRKTCGFCPAKPIARKPRRETASTISHSVCGIENFDSVAITFDSKNVLNMLYFKDDYYFESSIVSDGEIAEIPSMLDTSDNVQSLPWRTDPKTIKVGSFKVRNSDMFAMSGGIDAVAVTNNRYIVFEKGTGMVHEYNLGAPTVVYLRNYTIKSAYRDFPHETVDAAFVEFNLDSTNNTIHTLFRRDLMWQYKEVKSSDIRDDNHKIELEPIAHRQAVFIEKWHGVPACGIDSVIQYRGVPYFVKDNTFWPAVDSEPLIPRDITYNFIRCWEEEPIIAPVPPTCVATHDSLRSKEDDGENSSLSLNLSSLSILLATGVFSLINLW